MLQHIPIFCKLGTLKIFNVEIKCCQKKYSNINAIFYNTIQPFTKSHRRNKEFAQHYVYNNSLKMLLPPENTRAGSVQSI